MWSQNARQFCQICTVTFTSCSLIFACFLLVSFSSTLESFSFKATNKNWTKNIIIILWTNLYGGCRTWHLLTLNRQLFLSLLIGYKLWQLRFHIMTCPVGHGRAKRILLRYAITVICVSFLCAHSVLLAAVHERFKTDLDTHVRKW